MVEFYPYPSVGMHGGSPGKRWKIEGTVHLVIGDNSHMGGTVTADLHQGFIIPEPHLLLDDQLVIEGGQGKI